MGHTQSNSVIYTNVSSVSNVKYLLSRIWANSETLPFIFLFANWNSIQSNYTLSIDHKVIPRLSADLDYPRIFGPKSGTPNFFQMKSFEEFLETFLYKLFCISTFKRIQKERNSVALIKSKWPYIKMTLKYLLN